MDKEMKEGQECGHCGMCGHGRGGMCGHHLMHVIVKILVAVFIFWCGVQFGELRGMLHGNYSDGYGYGMMGGWSQQGIVQ